MSRKVRVLALAGSLRVQSFNKKLIRISARMAEEAGAKVTLVDLKDFPMPIYDGDIEAAHGIPEHGARLKKLMVDHDGFLISSAEYNSSISAVLKNAIDWASRPVPGEPSLVAFRGKAAALMSASPGALGGLRGLVHLRSILGNIGVLVMPDQVALPRANEAFNEDGSLKDKGKETSIDELVRGLVNLLTKLTA